MIDDRWATIRRAMIAGQHARVAVQFSWIARSVPCQFPERDFTNAGATIGELLK
jgi:hypothetical protein